MSELVRFWLVRAGEVVAAVGLLVLLGDPAGEPALSQAAALALGLLVALALFPLALVVRPEPGPGRAGIAAAAGLYLTVRAAVEEIFWRLALTGRVAIAVGWPVGLTVGTLGFAFAHARAGRAAVLTHALTGLAFGSVYLATGRLIAPVAAHALYNLLVLRASLCRTA